ncbi:MAG: UdgX family uracil-DNA binding protein [Actinomycetota bacterium]|nr:UdgX family uracil-DNA binding protein [Actinomycetota bacterium]
MKALREAAPGCRGCPLHEDATQVVFGRGPARAETMLVGEQPGDREDVEGEPFVGPAGRVLGEALERVGVDRRTVYVTNAVKHFKFIQRGKRRIHQRPGTMEMNACAPWLDAELAVVKPRLLIALGATAARALYGTKVKVMRDRGELVESDRAPLATVTIHPSALLRLEGDERRLGHAEFERDLARAFERLG